MNSKAVFAGTFDPFTLGHYDIAKRASKLFDELTVAVFDGTNKTTMFSIDKRMEIVELSLKELKNVNIVKFDVKNVVL